MFTLAVDLMQCGFDPIAHPFSLGCFQLGFRWWGHGLSPDDSPNLFPSTLVFSDLSNRFVVFQIDTGFIGSAHMAFAAMGT
jgi:hypothetical protein